MKYIPLILTWLIVTLVSVGTFGVAVYIDFFTVQPAPVRTTDVGKTALLYLIGGITGIISLILAAVLSDDGTTKQKKG